jgi:phosphate/sulfate permease
MEWIVPAAALLPAFANGANDDMKGAATLYGSGVVGYRTALGLATVSTGCGSLASTALAGALVQAFSARVLVPDAVLVRFARNETPKILGLAAGLGIVSPRCGAFALGGAMALGGWLGSRRCIAETLAKKLNPMAPPHGLAASAATSLLVASASPLGLPVSIKPLQGGRLS